MIDPLREEVICPTEATRHYPRDRRGRKVSIQTVYRHMTHGVKGIVLESIRTPRLCTSKEAVSRFFLKLSERPAPSEPVHHVVQGIPARRIEEELDRLGL